MSLQRDSRTPKPDIKNLLELFYNNANTTDITGRKNLEFEVRFGTRGFKKITKIDFDNVAQYLLSKGFRVHKNDISSLRVRNQFNDPRTGKTKISNLRTEIYHDNNISNYCRKNSLMEEGTTDSLMPGIEFLQKLSYFKENSQGEGSAMIRPVNFDDLNFRVTIQEERKLKEGNGLVNQLLNDWNDKKKLFRYLTRTTLVHKDYPFIQVDLSVVKTSNAKENGNLIPTYNVIESNVFNNPESYEVEIEVLPFKRVSFDDMNDKLRSTIKYVLCGIQQSSYPIGLDEMRAIKYNYMELVTGKPHEKGIYSKHFIGPSSITLELRNIQPLDDDMRSPNIRENYCVTDKADGLRKLLYVNGSGKIYFIDMNMNVQFTGLITKSREHFNSILDGEHIQYNDVGEFSNKYMIFDVYFINSEDQRSKEFANLQIRDGDDQGEGEDEFLLTDYRFHLLAPFVESLNSMHVVPGNGELIISIKNFSFPWRTKDRKISIFEACNEILTNIHNKHIGYNTDGLILTPCNLGVAMSLTDTEVKNYKITWQNSFKWKPPHHNTIDFLVTTQKEESGKDETHNIFNDGKDMSSMDQIVQYKTLILRVGFDESKHGYINPCEMVIQNKLPSVSNIDDNDKYKPIAFHPINPIDNKAYLCNIQLKEMNGNKYMSTEDNLETFDDNTIVEFRYDESKDEGWRWVPIKVRYDKTAEFRNGLKNFGNAHHVAQSVWSSIHNPVTIDMLRTGINIPPLLDDDDVYYNRGSKDTRNRMGGSSRALRDFHNLYVKNKLITSVSNRGGSLIDLAVGKGGDFTKWIKSRLGFVFGIDISRDNIENRLDGACARYLNYLKKVKKIPRCLFVQGNCGLNIMNGDALYTDSGKKITQAIMGMGPKDETKLGAGVYRYYGIGREGFDVVSTQFAIHYFFENPDTLHTYLENVSNMCKLGGYFTGTSYDGRSLFNELRDLKPGDAVNEYKNGEKIWEVSKSYDIEEFNNDTSCIGLAVDVYQDTINKVFREYLVNYDYLIQLLDSYGFDLLTNDEAKTMKMPNSIGMFGELFTHMMNEIKRSKTTRTFGKTKEEMEYGTADKLEFDDTQKRVSFLNKYFIFKKTRQVNANEVKKTYLSGSNSIEKTMFEDRLTKQTREEITGILDDIDTDTIQPPISEKQTVKKIIKRKKPTKFVLKSSIAVPENEERGETIASTTAIQAPTTVIPTPIPTIDIQPSQKEILATKEIPEKKQTRKKTRKIGKFKITRKIDVQDKE